MRVFGRTEKENRWKMSDYYDYYDEDGAKKKAVSPWLQYGAAAAVALLLIVGIATPLLLKGGGEEEASGPGKEVAPGPGKEVAPGPGADKPGTTCVASKRNAVYLLFAMDGSGSVNHENFVKQKDFYKSIVDGLDIENFSVGLIQFSDDAKIEFPLQKGRTKDEIKGLIDKVNQQRRNTYTDKAIDTATNMFSSITYEDKTKDQNVMIVTTDGIASDTIALDQALTRYNDEAVVTTTTYAIGIGNANLPQLKKIASSDDKAFYSITFEDLQNFVDKISKASNSLSCGGS